MSEEKLPEHGNHPDNSRELWDSAAATFDDEPDHGLRDPVVRTAWMAFLTSSLPPAPSAILDIGCGTGSLSLVLAELGHDMTGIDFSPAMITLAEEKAKAAQRTIVFQIMDAAVPQFPPETFDAIVCRHLLWALPEPAQVLQRWVDLLKPGGSLLLVEGFWVTGVGLHAEDITRMIPTTMAGIVTQNLSVQWDLWGRVVTDERYAISARRLS